MTWIRARWAHAAHRWASLQAHFFIFSSNSTAASVGDLSVHTRRAHAGDAHVRLYPVATFKDMQRLSSSQKQASVSDELQKSFSV